MLSDYDILDRLNSVGPNSLRITPLIDPRQIQPSSVDVRLGFHFKTVRNVGISALDPIEKDPSELALDTEKYTFDVKLDVGRPFYIHPGEFALATTLEYIALPNDLAAILEGRSSLGRLGITVHSTAGFVDPGFRGRVTYEMQNEGTQPVALYPGMRVAQLVFFQLNSQCIEAYTATRGSKYVNQLTTTTSRWYADRDLRVFRRKFSRRSRLFLENEQLQQRVRELEARVRDLQQETS